MSDKVKKQPDVDGYYWAKYEGCWLMVKVFPMNTGLFYKTFDGNTHFTRYINEWQGPLVPENVAVYKTISS